MRVKDYVHTFRIKNFVRGLLWVEPALQYTHLVVEFECSSDGWCCVVSSERERLRLDNYRRVAKVVISTLASL